MKTIKGTDSCLVLDRNSDDRKKERKKEKKEFQLFLFITGSLLLTEDEFVIY